MSLNKKKHLNNKIILIYYYCHNKKTSSQVFLWLVSEPTDISQVFPVWQQNTLFKNRTYSLFPALWHSATLVSVTMLLLWCSPFSQTKPHTMCFTFAWDGLYSNCFGKVLPFVYHSLWELIWPYRFTQKRWATKTLIWDFSFCLSFAKFKGRITFLP